MLQQGRPLIPGHGLARGRDVVALEARHRNGDERLDPRLTGEAAIILHYLVEVALVIADQVHLVDGEPDPADAEQINAIGRTARLDQPALARVGPNDGEIRDRKSAGEG